ncbi:hypothetical protein CD30_05695 [Ureibacillus massiliensis 4400831 = CIP 108448 = CCUG 49529]|uniref:Uncharacterized protein n=1 Tax=Ureibacillus massiliensis 4400831 = CIP 108448 = CCUG 49529 TaxID=1211035 RepID=A0A0A3J722_9BACL|nr:hypothetical protein [Ureibacillus massiliensis]KGR91545.1 hypothetical protein CD30_05695 [Ureibacillus massiliensis 4400831 = CIP 108448 = CCUG 49529]
MEYFILGLSLWLIIIVSLLFMVRGFQKKSRPMIYISIVGYLLPMLHFATYEKYYLAFALLSLFPLIKAFYMKG